MEKLTMKTIKSILLTLIRVLRILICSIFWIYIIYRLDFPKNYFPLRTKDILIFISMLIVCIFSLLDKNNDSVLNTIYKYCYNIGFLLCFLVIIIKLIYSIVL